MSPRYRIDEHGIERMLAADRPAQTCRACRNYLTRSAFAPSRIRKRDYECRRCNTARCARERLQGRRS